MTTKTIAKKSASVKASVVNVTPTMAASWLAANEANRSLRPRLVDKYARDMSLGNWAMTGEPIKFACSGTLLDGQHRLYALVQSNTTQQMLVVKGVEADAQLVMDTGSARTASDALTLAGHKYTALVAASARLAANWEAGAFVHAHQHEVPAMSHSDIIAYVEAHPELEVYAAQYSSTWRRIRARGSVVLFTAWACGQQAGPDEAWKFFDDLAEMRTTGVGDPRLALLRRFQNAAETREKIPQIKAADMIFRAWNAHRAGVRMSKIHQRHASDNFTDPR